MAALDDLTPLVRIMQDTWPAYYGPNGDGDAGADLALRAKGADFPMGWAVVVDGVPVGTAALTRHDSFGAQPDEGPWLIGLVVAENHRRRGIGDMLIATAETCAARFGQTRIFTTTQAAGRIVKRRGWAHLRDVQDSDGQDWAVLHKCLT